MGTEVKTEWNPIGQVLSVSPCSVYSSVVLVSHHDQGNLE